MSEEPRAHGEGVRAEVGEVPWAAKLRAAALLAVMLFHYAVLARAGEDPWLVQLARAPWLQAIVHSGWAGVDAFFVLSGFLLGLPWLARADRGEAAPAALAFYRRRFWRLAPAYYVHLAVLFGALMPLLGGAALIRSDLYVVGWNVVAHGFFLQQATPLTAPSLGLNGALWTLTLEVQFYALLPLVAPLFTRRPLLVLVAAIGTAIAWRVGSAHSLGPLVSAVQALGRHWAWSDADVRAFLAPQLPAYLGHFALGMALAAAWLRHRGPAPRAPRREDCLDRIGRVSYSAYLWHVPALLFLARYVAPRGSWALLPLYLAGTLAIAAVSWRYLEPPFAGWRGRRAAYEARERDPTASAATIAADCSSATPHRTPL
jgi:peptidoglycan/LPS O-acetylase OafA/YrhL